MKIGFSKNMTIMKNISNVVWLFAAAIVLFSCQKEDVRSSDTIDSSDGQNQIASDRSGLLLGFGASVEPASKLSVDVESGNLAFEADDEVLVYIPESEQSGIYKYDESSSLFVPKTEIDALHLGSQYAYVYYPAGLFSNPASGSAVLTMPEAVEAGSVENLGDKVPMSGLIVAGDAQPKASFKSLCSILRVRLTGNADDFDAGVRVSSVSLSNTTVPVAAAGTYTVTWDGHTDASANIPSVATSSDGYEMSIEPESLMLDPDDATDFYFLLPPVGEMQNMTVTASLSNSRSYSRVRSNLSVQRGKILSLAYRAGNFYAGDGSQANPWQIKTVDDYVQISKNFNANASFRDDCYKQVADIEFGTAGHYMNLSSCIIGNSTNKFSGSYDGNGKYLKFFSISSAGANTGLFGYANNAKLLNIKADHFSVSGTQQVGAIVGRSDGTGSISGCVTSNGTVTGTGGAVAGIAGQSAHSISSCTNEASVTTAGNNLGGIAGYCSNAITISACANSGSITNTAGQQTGGIVGKIDNAGAKFIECHNSGSVSGTGLYVGGITGDLRGIVDACYNTGTVTGEKRSVGGIAGRMFSGTVKRSFSKGKISGLYCVGGIVGLMDSSPDSGGSCLVINCAASAEVTATDTTYPGHGHEGGLVGSMTSASEKYTIVANCVEFPAKIYGQNHDGTSAGAIIGRMNGTKEYSILHNCYSLGWSGQIGNSTDGGDTITKTKNSGGIYGYLDYGTVIDCYYTTTDGRGNRSTSGNWQELGNNVNKKLSGDVRDGKEQMEFGDFYGGHAGGTMYLVDALNYGGYASETSIVVDKTYTSSAGTETFSEWVPKSQTNGQAIPKALKDLGANYYQ